MIKYKSKNRDNILICISTCLDVITEGIPSLVHVLEQSVLYLHTIIHLRL